MRHLRRSILAMSAFLVALLAYAPAALAAADDGQGWWGETTDKQITDVMFITIGFFPTLIIVLSLIQWRLDKRKHARLEAEKARRSSAEWRGGW